VPDDDAPEGPSEDARFDTLLAFFLMLPSILLMPRPFMDFIAALEPRAAAGDFLDVIVEEGVLDRRRRGRCLESGFFGGEKATTSFSK
jgi:hypothetical protein